MQLAQQGILMSKRGSNPFFIGVIGDSNADGASSSIPTVSHGVLYNYTGGSWNEITTQGVANQGAIYGSMWQPFATSYKAEFGRPVYLMNGAQGGSHYSDAATAYSWGPSGTLRAAFVAKVVAGLAAVGGSRLDMIVVNLGINDCRAGLSIANIRTGITSLYTWITGTFPGVPVLVVQMGRSEVAVSNLLMYQTRVAQVDAAFSFSDVSMCGNAMIWVFLSGYEADNLHYNNTTFSGMADNLVRWLRFNALSKWGRSALATLFDTPSAGRITLLDNFISSQVTSGNLARFIQLTIFKTGDVRNWLVDLSFVSYGNTSGNPTFVANDCMTLDGVDDYFGSGINVNVQAGTRYTQTSVLLGVALKTNRSAGNGCLFGGTEAAASLSVVQNGVRYRVNDLTLSTGTDTLFQNNTL
jgi:hypothetical protein